MATARTDGSRKRRPTYGRDAFGRRIKWKRIPRHLHPRPAHDYDLDAEPDNEHAWYRRALPGATFLLTRYPRPWLRRDLVAGIAVAAYLVPQVMAYSAIVNVAPVAGLWSALAAIVMYALLGTSRVLSSGPESTIALMAAASIAPLTDGDPTRAMALCGLLSLLVAGWCLIARILRAGIVVELLSQPLLVGYLAGGAVLMVVGQLGKLTGTDVEGESIVDQVRSFVEVAPGTNMPALVVGMATLAVIVAIHTVRPSWPAPLIAVALATLTSVLLDLEGRGLAVVGEVPSGLPLPHLPAVGWGDVQALILPALGVAIVGFSDNMLIAAGFPSPPMEGETPSERRADPQAELIAMAGVQAAVGLVGGYPVSSSGSRTALAIASGARSQVYALTAGVCVVAVLLVAGPLMSAMPQAALGGVVVYAASRLLSIPEFLRLKRFRRREASLAVITMLGTVLIGILAGVGLAIAISLLEMAHRLARPHEGVLGRVPGIPGMHDVSDYPEAETLPGCIFYRYDAPLFFANINDLRQRVARLVELERDTYPDQPLYWVVLNVEANVEVDITAADGLRDLAAELAAQNIRLGLARVKLDLYEPLRRSGVIDVIGRDMLFATLPVAEQAYLDWALQNAQQPPAVTQAGGDDASGGGAESSAAEQRDAQQLDAEQRDAQQLDAQQLDAEQRDAEPDADSAEELSDEPAVDGPVFQLPWEADVAEPVREDRPAADTIGLDTPDRAPRS